MRPGESEGREVGVRGLAGVGVGAAGAIGGRGLGPGCRAYWGGRGRGAADPAGGGELVQKVPLPRWAPPATAQGRSAVASSRRRFTVRYCPPVRTSLFWAHR